MKDQMLWISFNWLLISYVITYGCAEMLSDVLDAFDYSFWQLWLKTAGRHFLICNGLLWCANKSRQLDEWSCSAYLVLLSCSAVLKANTIRDQPGKEWEKLQRARGFSACRSALLSAPRQGEPGSRDLGRDKAEVPISQWSKERQIRSLLHCWGQTPAHQPQGYSCVIPGRPAHTNRISLHTQPANGPPGTHFSLRAHLGMPEPTLWHALISWQSSSLFNRKCFPILLTPNDTLFYKCRLPLIAPWQKERQTPPFPSKDCHLINRQVSLRIYSPALSFSLYSVTEACEGLFHLSVHFNNCISANLLLCQRFTSWIYLSWTMERAVNLMSSAHLTSHSLPGSWSQCLCCRWLHSRAIPMLAPSPVSSLIQLSYLSYRHDQR